jgi:hypothetical protein
LVPVLKVRKIQYLTLVKEVLDEFELLPQEMEVTFRRQEGKGSLDDKAGPGNHAGPQEFDGKKGPVYQIGRSKEGQFLKVKPLQGGHGRFLGLGLLDVFPIKFNEGNINPGIQVGNQGSIGGHQGKTCPGPLLKGLHALGKLA